MSEEKGKEPSREEVVAWYKDQIELSTLRADLAEQQARAVRFESERLQHAVMIANIKTAGDEIMSSEQEDESLEETKS
jgi:chorismate mutase